MAVVTLQTRAHLGHGLWRAESSLLTIGRETEYIGDVMRGKKFDHHAEGLAEARALFIGNCLELADVISQQNVISQQDKEQKQLLQNQYVKNFEDNLGQSKTDLFEDFYRYFRLIGVVRGETLALGQTLLEYGVENVMLPPNHLLDQTVHGAKSRLRDREIPLDMDYPVVAADALSELAATIQVETTS